MNLKSTSISDFKNTGFYILNEIYSEEELEGIINCLESFEKSNNSNFRSNNVFAIRKLLIEIPELKSFLFNDNLRFLLSKLFEGNSFLTKAIYFDKPKQSNWFVPIHQDLSISVADKKHVEGYNQWTFKKGQYGVIPPLGILENTVTIRIHLDDTNSGNGALNVVPKSHLQGIVRVDENYCSELSPQVCEVRKGGVMLMKPLTLHSSNRSNNSSNRRVIHLEFNSIPLDKNLNWLEYDNLN
ncbi:MAG: phytanoyl-CoA dioxygenase [Bacteroidetes bacterium MedPE-SWsnd-G2]|nr:MAG: phytanoyl-CoA dioxygenase [Bacteroidetes bacterium MedPE-SWsnd-G2]